MIMNLDKKFYLLIILLFFAFSACNTYKWQKKRYYNEDRTKNWNNYDPERTKKMQEEEIRREYYKK